MPNRLASWLKAKATIDSGQDLGVLPAAAGACG